MAANPITYIEIEAYCRLTGWVLTPWEVGSIRSMDSVLQHVLAKKRDGKNREPLSEVKASDAGGVKALFRGMGAKSSGAVKTRGSPHS